MQGETPKIRSNSHPPRNSEIALMAIYAGIMGGVLSCATAGNSGMGKTREFASQGFASHSADGTVDTSTDCYDGETMLSVPKDPPDDVFGDSIRALHNSLAVVAKIEEADNPLKSPY